MQIFKTFFKLSKHSIGIMITYTVIFLILLEIMASNRGPSSVSEFTESSINVAIFDNDQSLLSTGLTNYITSKHNIVKFDYSLDTIRDKMYSRAVDYVLIIPENFYEKTLNNEDISLNSYKLPESVSTQFVELQINNFISAYSTFLKTEKDASTAYAKTLEALEQEATVSIYNNTSGSTSLPLIHYFYLFLPYILISVLTMCITPILIAMNKEEIKIRTLCSKMPALKRNIYITLSSFSIGFIIFLFFGVFSIIRFPKEMFTMVGLLRLLNCFIYMVVCLSICFIFGIVLKSKNLISMASTIVGLGSSFLTGVFVDRFLLAPSVLAVGKLLPTYWYVDVELALTDGIVGNKNTILAGYGIQILFAVLLFAVGIVCSKSTKKE